jgi:3-hydroxy-9,10-secoandrosta-1,3,5(10)-triene-9,17-dione monooxygenase reductase component
VNILAEEQEILSRRFAEEPGAVRFQGVGFTRDEHGIARLDGVLAWLTCRVTQRHDGGDHTMVVAEVQQAATFDRRPLVYHRGGYGGLED